MTRTIDRKYVFTQSEVREALIAMMKAKGVQAPEYIGDTKTCFWENHPDGAVAVKWSVEDDLTIP